MKKIFSTDKAPQAIGPYSQAVSAGDFLFLSGQIPLRPDGSMVEGSIEEQTEQVMENILAVLKATDLDIKNIIKTTIYLIDLKDFEKVNEVYGSYFERESYLKANPPARATVQVVGLPKGAKIEIEVVAFLN